MNRFILLSFCSVLFAQDVQLKQVVISSSAIQSERMKGTVGQPVIGTTTTDNYILSAGFWGSVSRMFLDVDDEVVLPTEYSISNAYPNPFNPVTNIDIAVPESGLMQFAIYDILGRQVFEHKQTFANPGHYRFSWSGKNNHGSSLSSGVYLLTVRFEENYYKQKITLLK
jgi:hypothetical protein